MCDGVAEQVTQRLREAIGIGSQGPSRDRAELEAPGGVRIESRYGNQPIVVPNDPDRIAELLR